MENMELNAKNTQKAYASDLAYDGMRHFAFHYQPPERNGASFSGMVIWIIEFDN